MSDDFRVTVSASSEAFDRAMTQARRAELRYRARRLNWRRRMRRWLHA